MPVPRPLAAIERASGSVNEIWPSGAFDICRPICFSWRMCFDRGDFAFDMADSGLGHECRFEIGPVEFNQVACDAVLQLLHPSFELAVGEVLVAVVDRFEFAAIDRDNRLREQIEAAAQHDEVAADSADRLAIVLAEVRDRFEVRHQFAGQPY